MKILDRLHKWHLIVGFIGFSGLLLWGALAAEERFRSPMIQEEVAAAPEASSRLVIVEEQEESAGLGSERFSLVPETDEQREAMGRQRAQFLLQCANRRALEAEAVCRTRGLGSPECASALAVVPPREEFVPRIRAMFQAEDYGQLFRYVSKRALWCERKAVWAVEEAKQTALEAERRKWGIKD